MRSAWLAVAVAMGCSFNEVKPPPAADDGPPILDGEAVSAAIAPAPIAGGTLFVTRSTTIFAGNPDRDVVDVFSNYYGGGSPSWTAPLPAGSEPGRMVEGSNDVVYVALRRAGKIATLDAKARTVALHDACPSPRGVAFEAANGRFPAQLHVACAGGELLHIDVDTWSTKSVVVERDLRDILLDGYGGYWISRFRSAELLHVDADGHILSRAAPFEAPDAVVDDQGAVESARYQPNTAWRIAYGSDGIYMLHQFSTTRHVATKPTPNTTAPGEPARPGSSAPYGGVGTPGSPGRDPVCDPKQLVFVGLTRFTSGNPNGSEMLTVPPPAVDMAVINNMVTIAHVSNGTSQHVPTFGSGTPRCSDVQHAQTANPVVSVAVGTAGLGQQNIAQQARVDTIGSSFMTTLSVESATTKDTGHTVFHTPTSVGIACVSCHPEGGDDGHTWNFVDIGMRRTQSLRGGILATAPFHWNGDMHDISQLAHDVFTHRMGGGALSEEQVAVLGKWLDRVPAMPPPSWVDPQATARGSVIFGQAGCTKCHGGGHFSNNTNQDVGTGATLQVPSLINVGARAPFMHDGCAPTLMARLVDPKCGGGDHHGDVGRLQEAERNDLVTFLESL